MSSEVSVLIPAHGPSPFIKFTLESIVKSTVQPEEVLIIDDGLSKEAINVILSFSQHLPISIMPNSGRGLVEALNTGLSAAKCKYICRIDSDDQMAPSRIEQQVEFLKLNSNVVAVGSQCILIDSQGNEIGKTFYPTGCISTLESFSFRCLLAHPSTIYLKQAAMSIGGYRTMFRWMKTDIAEDFDFWLRLRTQGEIFNLDKYLTYYRVHEDQISSRFNSAQLVGSAYIAAFNFTELSGGKTNKIDLHEGSTTEDLTRFNSVLKNSPFILHRAIAGLQVSNLLQAHTSGKRFGNLMRRFLIKGLNFLFRIYLK
jgi:glycosyltransferase involved in cell wall biosynthesis